MNLEEAHKRLLAAYTDYCRRKRKQCSSAQAEIYVGERLASIAQGSGGKWDEGRAASHVAQIEAALKK